jgi:hypothetical protein
MKALTRDRVGADNLGKRLLAEFRYGRLRLPFLAEVGHQEK